MKHLHWVIIADSHTRLESLTRLLESFDGSDVAYTFHATASGSQPLVDDHPEVNAVYIAAHASLTPTLAVMMLKRRLPVTLENPTSLSYDDFIRIGRISQQTDTSCFINWTYYDVLTIKRLQKRLALTGNDPVIALNLMATYPTSCTDFRSESIIHLHFLHEMFGIIIDAKGLSNQRSEHSHAPVHTALLEFESSLVGTASWIGHTDDEPPHCRIRVITDRRSCDIVWKGDHQAADTITFADEGESQDIVNNDQTLIRQIIEDMQGFNLCTSTCLHSTPAAWTTDRIINDTNPTFSFHL